MKIADSSSLADSWIRRLLRLAAWNGLTLIAGVAVIGVGGEVYLRFTKPFMTSSLPNEFVPEVGLVRKPNTEMRYTNRLDFWTVQHSNSLGFLDREPPSPEIAAERCHIAVVGDSNVEAREVPVHAKLHVRLEKIAARRLPRLKITTSAFGRGSTGQVQQLAFYDRYVRSLRPKIVVLVFLPNDFMDNSPVLSALLGGWDPEHLPAQSIDKAAGGTTTFRPPQADYAEFDLGGRNAATSGLRTAVRTVRESSWLAGWLEARVRLLPTEHDSHFVRRVKALSRRPDYAWALAGWEPTKPGDLRPLFVDDDPPPVVREALEYTSLAMSEFKSRADADGARLVVLVSHRVTIVGTPLFKRVGEIAAAAGIPVVDQADYILRQGADLEDAQWNHDAHWNHAGHQWAAEALVEYIDRQPELCNDVE